MFCFKLICHMKTYCMSKCCAMRWQWSFWITFIHLAEKWEVHFWNQIVSKHQSVVYTGFLCLFFFGGGCCLILLQTQFHSQRIYHVLLIRQKVSNENILVIKIYSNIQLKTKTINHQNHCDLWIYYVSSLTFCGILGPWSLSKESYYFLVLMQNLWLNSCGFTIYQMLLSLFIAWNTG